LEATRSALFISAATLDNKIEENVVKLIGETDRAMTEMVKAKLQIDEHRGPPNSPRDLALNVKAQVLRFNAYLVSTANKDLNLRPGRRK
jgi:hypothetical protein